MSHWQEIQTEFRDIAALRRACAICSIPLQELTAETCRLTLQEYFHVDINLLKGTLGGDSDMLRIGQGKKLISRLTERYGVELAKLAIEEKGLEWTETTLDDGAIQLEVELPDEVHETLSL